ncbi:putative TIM-barrel fold metal-dependent hydrolase [Nocardia tenerifensis]|uniref:Putative TIM-barrel fold metal-dependent hydrolase n=1 Tax=Nocardia tenerifensis TaxID=228006 RepID=A0A318KC69_9NOCA|nr:amidohydrolase family protein [Nocardia tenerifensis]PXX69342.1 putative TIM-barrel fold metal-dependent hydrolase [Nocardia tenerifensis]
MTTWTPSPTRPTEFGRVFPPDESWLARQPKEEILRPELPIIDPHHHLWSYPGFRYLPAEFAADTGSGHHVVGTVHVECMSAYRTDGPPELRPVGETEFVAELAATNAAAGGSTGLAAGIIGRADFALGPDVVDNVIEHHLAAAQGRFRGLRFAAAWDASEQIALGHPGSRPHMLAEPAVRECARVVADRDLTLDLWILAPQLTDAADFADALPGLRLVLDHCGAPLGFGPYATDRAEHFAAWAHGIREVARRPNVVCKLGGLVATAAAFDYRTAPTPPTSEELAALWRPWFDTCVEAFGPQRCMFESNFPVDKMGTGYATLWNAFKRLAAGAAEAELAALFSDTARRTYRLTL